MINLLPENYSIGVECYFETGSPVNEALWPKFERYKETLKMTRKPMSFSNKVIRLHFNDVKHMIHNSVLRDAEFCFVDHMKNAGFKLTFDVASDAWIVNI